MSKHTQSEPARDFTLDEAANELQIHKVTVRRWIANGTLPAYRIKGSRVVRIRRADLEALKQPIGGAA
ncbi:helix-turn-helix domain-containing protein [Mycolicibacterium elephantis]|uniref:Helix-turn-helix domain-containing protein n=1 Tax=Mycolicibacterium elephantis DSM 44368 TaxID=1335622 RepID=A0A439DXX6_9MYCO|nr:helix-turn-helix domain-containing protein [Mycolicibacterium elephantis]MCV7222958.1 helix-turn-helix domain-containing protein [Mycolicibacterium elephantis]RWA22326.1 hypothetical protein MELE44368_13005 [Mycolicibacterium elephantis DSM 44368]